MFRSNAFAFALTAACLLPALTAEADHLSPFCSYRSSVAAPSAAPYQWPAYRQPASGYTSLCGPGGCSPCANGRCGVGTGHVTPYGNGYDRPFGYNNGLGSPYSGYSNYGITTGGCATGNCTKPSYAPYNPAAGSHGVNFNTFPAAPVPAGYYQGGSTTPYYGSY